MAYASQPAGQRSSSSACSSGRGAVRPEVPSRPPPQRRSGHGAAAPPLLQRPPRRCALLEASAGSQRLACQARSWRVPSRERPRRRPVSRICALAPGSRSASASPGRDDSVALTIPPRSPRHAARHHAIRIPLQRTARSHKHRIRAADRGPRVCESRKEPSTAHQPPSYSAFADSTAESDDRGRSASGGTLRGGRARHEASAP